MTESPNIARIRALIGDPTRARMLRALMPGRALTASELAAAAGVGKATASSRLAPLGLGPADLADHPAPQCRLCPDWSARRHHLSGRLGRAVLARMAALDWLRRSAGTRALTLTPPGRAAFERTFPALTARESLDAPEDCP